MLAKCHTRCNAQHRSIDCSFVNRHSDPTGLRARRTWWPSALCAFVSSGVEIVSFGFYLLYRSRAIESAGSTPSSPPGLIFVIMLIGIAAQGTALWGVSQRQQAGAPVSVRLGQWAIATYVVVSGVLFSLMITVGALGVLPNWIFQVAVIPLTLAYGCLGWASHGGTNPRQRWASRGLLVLALFGVVGVTGTLLGLRTGPGWLWLGSLLAAFRAAAWAMVGVWLWSVTVVSRSGDGLSNPNLGSQD